MKWTQVVVLVITQPSCFYHLTAGSGKTMDGDDVVLVDDGPEASTSIGEDKESVQSMISEVDILLESVESEIQRLESRKRSLMSQKKRLKDRLHSIEMEKIHAVDWTAKSRSKTMHSSRVLVHF